MQVSPQGLPLVQCLQQASALGAVEVLLPCSVELVLVTVESVDVD